jgi:hypothetical protein
VRVFLHVNLFVYIKAVETLQRTSKLLVYWYYTKDVFILLRSVFCICDILFTRRNSAFGLCIIYDLFAKCCRSPVMGTQKHFSLYYICKCKNNTNSPILCHVSKSLFWLFPNFKLIASSFVEIFLLAVIIWSLTSYRKFI